MQPLFSIFFKKFLKKYFGRIYSSGKRGFFENAPILIPHFLCLDFSSKITYNNKRTKSSWRSLAADGYNRKT